MRDSSAQRTEEALEGFHRTTATNGVIRSLKDGDGGVLIGKQLRHRGAVVPKVTGVAGCPLALQHAA